MNKNRVEETVLKFQLGSSCAQSVLSTYLPLLGISESVAHKMGAGLGGGIGGKQYVCGSLNAGAIVLSTYLGNETSKDSDLKENTAGRVRQFVDEFERKFGSAQCLDLVGVDINTEEGQKMAEEADIYRKTCDSCIEYVCHHLEEVLGRE